MVRIMVVDDEIDILFIVRRMLEKWSYEVDTFNNPVYAYETFKTNAQNYSLGIADINMPEMTGISLAALMLRVRPQMNIIIMTAYEISQTDLVSSIPRAEVIDILRKPFTRVQVCSAVKKQFKTPK